MHHYHHPTLRVAAIHGITTQTRDGYHHLGMISEKDNSVFMLSNYDTTNKFVQTGIAEEYRTKLVLLVQLSWLAYPVITVKT